MNLSRLITLAQAYEDLSPIEKSALAVFSYEEGNVADSKLSVPALKLAQQAITKWLARWTGEEKEPTIVQVLSNAQKEINNALEWRDLSTH